MFVVRRGDKGFSYVEVLLALSIVAVCMVSLLGLYVNQLRAVRHSRLHQNAVMVAERILVERVSATSSEQLADSGTEFFDNIEYHWRLSTSKPRLEAVSGETIKGLEKLSVQVSWGDRGRDKSSSVELQRIVAKRTQL